MTIRWQFELIKHAHQKLGKKTSPSDEDESSSEEKRTQSVQTNS
jgi:hypothetical protein